MVLTKESEDLLAALRSDATAIAHKALAPTVSIEAMQHTAKMLVPQLFKRLLQFLKPVCSAEKRYCTATRAGTGLAQQSEKRPGPGYSPSGQLTNVISGEGSSVLTKLAAIQVKVCLAKFHNPPDEEESPSAEEDREQVCIVCSKLQSKVHIRSCALSIVMVCLALTRGIKLGLNGSCTVQKIALQVKEVLISLVGLVRVVIEDTNGSILRPVQEAARHLHDEAILVRPHTSFRQTDL